MRSFVIPQQGNMDKREKEGDSIPGESETSDSESDSENSDLFEGTDDSGTDCELDGVIGYSNATFRFIFDEEAQAQSLDGIAYGIDENGSYFVIGKDGDTVSGLLVHCLIERNIKEGILLPITKLGASTTAVATDGN